MPIVAQSGGTDFPVIPKGQRTLTITEVKDLGMVPIPAQYLQYDENGKPKGATENHKVRLKFTAEDGSSCVSTYTVSIGERSTFYRDFKDVIGKELKPGFDFESLRGRSFLAFVTHTTKNGKTYANPKLLEEVPTPAPKVAAAKPALVDVGF